MNILILTGLPFRKYGNQSLYRFLKMLLNYDCSIDLYTSGNDSSGEIVVLEESLRIIKFKPVVSLIRKKSRKQIKKNNIYDFINSQTTFLLYTKDNFVWMIKKWLKFFITIIENIIVIFRIIKTRSKYDAVIGYEVSFTIAAKIISKIYKIPYINKFQGVSLKSSNRNISLCRKIFPDMYYCLNKADLCLMVNDGTDGKYYAEKRKNKNIYFAPHGVNTKEYEQYYIDQFTEFDKFDNKVIFFNNASSRFMKRVDRIIRPLQYLEEKYRREIVIVSTYNGDDKDDLIELAQKMDVENMIVFVTGYDHILSNLAIRAADVLLSVNDVANIGNPFLEAYYYRTPILTIRDKPLESFFREDTDGWLIDLDENFDFNVAVKIKYIVDNRQAINEMKKTKQNYVKTLEQSQKKEFSIIKNTVETNAGQN